MYDSRKIYFERVRRAKALSARKQPNLPTGGQIGKIEGVDREVKRTPDIYLTSVKIKVDKREDMEDAAGSIICENLRDEGHVGSGIKQMLNERIWRLLDLGYTYQEIALELGCNKSTIWMHKKRYGRMR